jgi:hypothetical protein
VVDKVDGSITKTVADLRRLVARLQEGTLVAIDSTVAGSHQVVNAMPFPNKNGTTIASRR